MAKKTKTEEEYADLVIQSLVQEDYSVSKPTGNVDTPNEPQDMNYGDAQEVHGMKVDEKSTNTEKDVEIINPQVPQIKKNKAKNVAANKEYIVKRDYEESFGRTCKNMCLSKYFRESKQKELHIGHSM